MECSFLLLLKMLTVQEQGVVVGVHVQALLVQVVLLAVDGLLARALLLLHGPHLRRPVQLVFLQVLPLELACLGLHLRRRRR
jgi:hypothetical protein